VYCSADCVCFGESRPSETDVEVDRTKMSQEHVAAAASIARAGDRMQTSSGSRSSSFTSSSVGVAYPATVTCRPLPRVNDEQTANTRELLEYSAWLAYNLHRCGLGLRTIGHDMTPEHPPPAPACPWPQHERFPFLGAADDDCHVSVLILLRRPCEK